MTKLRCSLCGGRLSEGRCTLCGLDNSIYNREISYPGNTLPEESRQKQKPQKKSQSRAAAAYRSERPGIRRAAHPAQRKPGKSGRLTGIVILIIILVIILPSVLPPIIEVVQSVIQDISSDSDSIFDTYFGDSYNDDADYDPYEYVTRDIPDTGEAYEIVLGNGMYKVGVHIPEGVYRAEVEEGAGSVRITDDENAIYDSVYLGDEEEYGEVTEADDLRLYNGAELQVGDGVIVKLNTENAQPLVQEISENPLTESVFLPEGTCISENDTVPQGIYDLTVDTSYEGSYGYSSITLIYPNGESRYFWADGSDYAVKAPQYTDILVRNIVIPEGTEISVEYGGVILVPSEGYYDVDYSEYEGT